MSEPVEVRKERVVAAPGVAASRSTVLPYGYKARQFVWLSVAVVDLFLALRFALLAAGAGDSGFPRSSTRWGPPSRGPSKASSA